MLQPHSDLEKSLLIIDDDAPLRDRLGKAMTKRGFAVTTVEGITQDRISLKWNVPNYAIVDLKLNDGFGLDIVEEIYKANKKARASGL